MQPVYFLFYQNQGFLSLSELSTESTSVHNGNKKTILSRYHSSICKIFLCNHHRLLPPVKEAIVNVEWGLVSQFDGNGSLCNETRPPAQSKTFKNFRKVNVDK